MSNKSIYRYLTIAALICGLASCGIPHMAGRAERKELPSAYADTQDSTNIANLKWRQYFDDPYLTALIDTALQNNQELNIVLQEIAISRNEIRVRKGEYLPFVGMKGGAGVDKTARYTNIGAMEANTEIASEREMPEPMTDLLLAAYASWEVDVWHKLRNAKKAAVERYLASAEGKNFVVTGLVAEIANAYYELLALDNELKIVEQNVAIQTNALEIVKLQKTAARVTELAVRKFEAEVMKTQSLQYHIRQQITETENRINFLLARYPQPIARRSDGLTNLSPQVVHTGLPAQLLDHRPDIRRAERELAAAKLDVKSAKADFYPSVRLTASVGYQAFDPVYFLKTPQSLLYSLAGDLIAPVVNRNAIKANYGSANARQLQAVYHYERTVLNAYTEVVNQMAKLRNLEQSYTLKSRQVEALTESINISGDLFKSARADYMEVLLTQRDALESKFELVETRKEQMNALVDIYRALGGGWN
jgi:outer membrane protein, multidrug efflux system